MSDVQMRFELLKILLEQGEAMDAAMKKTEMLLRYIYNGLMD